MPRRDAADWTPVVDIATTKDPNKYWQVQRKVTASTAAIARDVEGAVLTQTLRCTCPGYIFRTRKSGYRDLCKHLKYVALNPTVLGDEHVELGPKASVGHGPATAGAPVPIVRDVFADTVKAKFVDRFKGGYTAAALLNLTSGPSWNGFVNDLRPLMTIKPATTTTPATATAGRVRRIVIDE